MKSSTYGLRDATPADTPAIARLIRALAVYEKLDHLITATEADYHAALFTTPARAHAMVAELETGHIAGFALYFYNFSTFLGRPGLYLEDIFVEPAHRKHGIGRAFFRALAARAVAENCGRMEWSVLDWNAPAIDFYRAMGAVQMDEWTVNRLTGDALQALAQEA